LGTPDGTPPGWQHKGKECLFPRAALYQHIDGGAELNNQFGFDSLAVRDYAKDDYEVRVEIYKMNDPAGAGSVFAEITKGMASKHSTVPPACSMTTRYCSGMVLTAFQ
jgi:hypothetical protein